MTDQPLFYLQGNVIHKRPISRKTETGTAITIGFPVCTVSKYADPEEVLKVFNESAS